MNLPKRVNIYLFFFLLFLAVSFRAVYIHQQGADTWNTSNDAVVLADKGYAPWVLHPLSYFGMYPFSYPSGEFIVVSALMQVTGLDIMMIAFYTSIFFGIFSVYTVYLMARSFNKNDLYAFLCAITFSSFEFVLNITSNNLSTRGLFITIYPLILVFLQKSRKEKMNRYRFITLAFVTAIVTFSVHRLFLYLLVTILLPYLILVPLNYTWNKKKFNISKNIVRPVLLVVIISIFISQVLGYTFVEWNPNSIEERKQNLFQGEGPIFLALNLAGDYGIYYNMSSIFAPIGLFYLIVLPKKSFDERYLILVSTISIFFILDIKYFLYFLSPMVPLLVSYGLLSIFYLIKKNDNIMVILLCVLIILISMQFVRWYIERSYFLLILLWALGLIFLVKGIQKSLLISFPKESFGHILVGILIITTTFASAVTQWKAIDIMEEAKDGEGSITREGKIVDSAMWLKEFGSDGWIAEDSGLRLPLWSLSGTTTAADDLNVVDNPIFKTKLNPELNISRLMKGEDYMYDYDLPNRDNPYYAEVMIFLRNDNFYIERYKVNLIIISVHSLVSDEKVTGNTSFLFTSYLQEEKYSIYMNDKVAIFHYTSWGDN